MNIATIKVSGVKAVTNDYPTIPAGIVGATVTFEFTDPAWDGLNKTAVFRGCVTRDVLMTGNVVRIPAETVAQACPFLFVGVYGTDAADNLVIPTLWLSLGTVRDAADPSGDPGTDPGLPVWAQLQDRVEALETGAPSDPDSPGTPGRPGEDGGYYTPAVTQPTSDIVEFAFSPSKPDMPAVDPVQVKLPVGQGSGGNVDLTGYATEQYVKEYAQPKGEYLTAVPEGYAKTEDIPTKPEDIGAQPSGNYLTEVPSGYATEEFVKNKIAEAELGGEEVDLSGYAQKSELPTKVSQLQNDSGYLTAVPDGYAKTEDIPKNPADIGAQPEGDYALRSEIPSVPVKSVNGKTGAVSLTATDVKARPDSWMPTASDVGALPKSTVIPTVPTKVSAFDNDAGYLTEHQDLSEYAKKTEIPSVPVKSVNGKTGAVSLTASDVKARPDTWMPSASDVGAMPNTTKIPSKTSELTNDSGFITGYTETDPTVPAWAKESTKPSYSKSEVGLGNVDNVKQYSASNPPPYPVTSVNGKTGSVTLDIPGSYTIPDYWQSALNTAIATVKSLQTGKNCVTFAHFSDNHTRQGYSGMLIAEAMKKCHIPFCFYNGDSISSGYIATEAEMIAQEEAFADMMSVIPDSQFCRSVGNHDGYWAVSASERYTYTRAQNYELFFRKQATAQNKQFGDDGTYFYVDDIASKVRFIVLNTNGGSVDDAQLAWFRDIALKVDEGWAVVVISHQPISNHYHANISNAADIRAIITESGVEMIGWFSGHIHRDRIYTGMATNNTDDAVGADMGFKQVTITSDHTGIAYEAATEHTVAEDNKSHAIDFVTINRDTGMVYLTRLGIGNSREYRYGAEPEPTYTNLADPTSSDWLTDQRLNSSGGGTACVGAVVTNFISITAGDVIRVKGIDFTDHKNYASAPKNGVWSSSGTANTSAANDTCAMWEYSTENNGEIFVYKILSTTAVRFRLSGDLIGTAEDVIITKNEPIT